MAVSIIEKMESAFLGGKSFVLAGGAGSGKTHSLKEIINSLYIKNPLARIACITYTNVATNEISERCQTPDRDLWVSTIHSFLWENIKNYKNQLKTEVLKLVNAGGISYKPEEGTIEDQLKDKKIDYNGIYKKISEGFIGHDDLLLLAETMFANYPLLNKIFCDKYEYVLIDEYQDTSPKVVNIFTSIIKDPTNKTKVAFFGDSMQAIYTGGVGDLSQQISDKLIEEIQKEDNYRCSKSVIGLCNKIRTDGITQKPSHIDDQGNMDNKDGRAIFVYSTSKEVDDFRSTDTYKNIFEGREPDKALYLTHRLISREAGFDNLFSKYNEYYKSNDRLFGDTKDNLAKALQQIAEILYFYNNKKYNDFILATKFKITKHEKKQTLKDWVEQLTNPSLTIEQAINFMEKFGLLRKDDSVTEKQDLYELVNNIPFKEVQNLYLYETEQTPYSTQHGIKGAEFDNVLVVLDNGKWRQYDFEKLFGSTHDGSYMRTLKIFYVCVSRTKNNLAVFMKNPSQTVINKAKEWFGDGNVIPI